jgi:small subunit ribosomal protein S6
MRERRRDYELMFIISPLRSSEEDIATTIGRVHQAITAAGGEVVDTDQNAPWGRRKFAYPIREYAEGEASRRAFNEGFYVLCHFSLSTARIPELERSLKLNDAVLRYLLTLVDTRAQATAGAPAMAGAVAGTGSLSASDEDKDEDKDEDEDEDGLEDEDAEGDEA